MVRIDSLFKLASKETGFGVRRWTKPENLEGLRYAPFAKDYEKLSKDALQVQKAKPKFSFGKKRCLQGVQPEISTFDTGINDNRLAMLKVEKRVNCDIGNTDYPIDYTFMDEYGQIRLKPHLYLDGIQVKSEYARQGVCYSTEKQIVELSRKEGYGGRVILLADKMTNADTPIVRSSLAHWKSGFRFCDDSSNKIMERVQKGELPQESAPLGYMYYPL